MDDVTGRDTYTAEQRETLESGLRTLARMIARAQWGREGIRVGKDTSSASRARAHRGDACP